MKNRQEGTYYKAVLFDQLERRKYGMIGNGDPFWELLTRRIEMGDRLELEDPTGVRYTLETFFDGLEAEVTEWSREDRDKAERMAGKFECDTAEKIINVIKEYIDVKRSKG